MLPVLCRDNLVYNHAVDDGVASENNSKVETLFKEEIITGRLGLQFFFRKKKRLIYKKNFKTTCNPCLNQVCKHADNILSCRFCSLHINCLYFILELSPSNGFLIIEANGGLNQQRLSVSYNVK